MEDLTSDSNRAAKELKDLGDKNVEDLLHHDTSQADYEEFEASVNRDTCDVYSCVRGRGMMHMYAMRPSSYVEFIRPRGMGMRSWPSRRATLERGFIRHIRVHRIPSLHDRKLSKFTEFGSQLSTEHWLTPSWPDAHGEHVLALLK